MKAIDSNDKCYQIYVRGMAQPIKMTHDGGQKLASYLEKEPSAFVHIKDVAGKEYTIRTMTIDRIEKFDPQRLKYKTPKELGMPDLSTSFR